jgi:hypothetical protein
MDNFEQAMNAVQGQAEKPIAEQDKGLFEFLDKQNPQPDATANEAANEAVNEVANEAVSEAVNEVADDPTEGAEEVEIQEEENIEQADNTDVVEDVSTNEEDLLLDLEAGLQPDEFISKYNDKLQELGVEAKSIDEFFDKVKSIDSELKEAKAQVETVFANPMLKEANELARQGGDWQQYLAISEVDYDAFPDATLVLYDVRASMGEDDANAFVEEMTEAQLKFHADKVRKDFKSKQGAEKEKIKTQAKEYQQWFDTSVEQAVKSVSAVGGVKIPEQSRTKIAKLLTTYNQGVNATEFNAKYFLNEKGQPDFKKMSEVAYKLEMFDAIVDVAKKNAKTEGKKELMKTITNVKPQEQRNIADATPKKELTYQEALKKGQAQLL